MENKTGMLARIAFGLVYWVHTDLYVDKSSFFHIIIAPLYADWYHRMFSRFAAKKDTSVPLSEKERKKYLKNLLPCPV